MLIDDTLVTINPADIADGDMIAALGLGDTAPASSTVVNRGLGQRPLSPVHGKALQMPDGSWQVEWVRRARGGWLWADEVELALNEPAELWQVTYGSSVGSVLTWNTTMPRLDLTSAQVSALGTVTAAHSFSVRQIGRAGLSLPLTIAPPQ